MPTVIDYNVGQFQITKNLFREYTGYTEPLSYDEWNSLPQDHKAAVLYLQFFEQITLAWYKLKSIYSLEEDGVAEILQYLNKNVSKIEQDKNRFKPAYIYKVAYNCLYCLCRDPNRYKRTFENEVSNLTTSENGDVLDLFATIVSDHEIEDQLDKQIHLKKREQFWNLIEDMGTDTLTVVSILLGETSIEKSKLDIAEFDSIVAELRIKLEPFENIF